MRRNVCSLRCYNLQTKLWMQNSCFMRNNENCWPLFTKIAAAGPCNRSYESFLVLALLLTTIIPQLQTAILGPFYTGVKNSCTFQHCKNGFKISMVGFHCLFPDSHKCSNLLESDFSYYFCKPTTLHIANRQIFERIKNNNTHTPKFKMGLFSPYLICFGWVFLVAVHSHTSQNSLFCHRLSTAQTITEKNMNSQVLRCI